MIYRSPYPYFGGKSKLASRIWERLGNPRNYVEPFLGSAAVLLARPDPEWRGAIETVNDANGYIANFWRALQADPEAVAFYTDWPVNENDLHARHWWLLNRKEDMRSRLEGDSDWYDAKAAGWWVWGMAAWIGSGFCDGNGRWYVENGKLIHAGNGQGVQRKLIHAGNAGRGGLYDYLYGLAERMKRVRVACGDWARVCGYSVTTAHGLTGVYLDPPYRFNGRYAELYGEHESASVFDEVVTWAVDNGNNPLLRIAVSGYGDDDVMQTFAAAGWTAERWKARKGFGGQRQNGNNANREREVIWYSPHCLPPIAQELPLFALMGERA